ncbi:unnamed protein product [Calicophoron daubneyi]|uniref:Uncharacterized protein n=1 Tax=Calicophoron daubneyi TaxID=300641 RepID=A0AAV2T1L1_CALDB
MKSQQQAHCGLDSTNPRLENTDLNRGDSQSTHRRYKETQPVPGRPHSKQMIMQKPSAESYGPASQEHRAHLTHRQQQPGKPNSSSSGGRHCFASGFSTKMKYGEPTSRSHRQRSGNPAYRDSPTESTSTTDSRGAERRLPSNEEPRGKCLEMHMES